MMAPAPAVLRRIKRKVGIADDRFGSQPIVRRQRDADRGADDDAMVFDRIGFRQLGNDPLRQSGQFLAAMIARQNDLELVPAQPADAAILVDRIFQPLCHLGQQVVARRMPHGIVDLLEAVEVQQEDRAGPPFAVGRGQDLLQRAGHLDAVGQARQRIVMGQARHLLFRAQLFGQVVARSAKAQVIARTVIDRPPADRPPAFLAPAGGAQGQVQERRTRGQVKGQRPLAIQALLGRIEQFGQGPPQQPTLRHAQDFANGRRDIDQQAAPVGFPEPALPGLFIVAEDFLGPQLVVFALPLPPRVALVGVGLADRGNQANGRADGQAEPDPPVARDQGNARPQGDMGGNDAVGAALQDDAGHGPDHDQGAYRVAPVRLGGIGPQRDGQADQEHRQGSQERADSIVPGGGKVPPPLEPDQPGGRGRDEQRRHPAKHGIEVRQGHGGDAVGQCRRPNDRCHQHPVGFDQVGTDRLDRHAAQRQGTRARKAFLQPRAVRWQGRSAIARRIDALRLCASHDAGQIG